MRVFHIPMLRSLLSLSLSQSSLGSSAEPRSLEAPEAIGQEGRTEGRIRERNREDEIGEGWKREDEKEIVLTMTLPLVFVQGMGISLPALQIRDESQQDMGRFDSYGIPV